MSRLTGEDTWTSQRWWARAGVLQNRITHLLGCITSENLQEKFGASLRRLNVLYRLWQHQLCPFVLSGPFFELGGDGGKVDHSKGAVTDLSPAHHEVRALRMKTLSSHPQTATNRLVILVSTCMSQNPSWMSLSYEHSRNTRLAKGHCRSSNKRFETIPKC